MAKRSRRRTRRTKEKESPRAEAHGLLLTVMVLDRAVALFRDWLGL
ncbi:hypothetical protein GCM10012275_60610 [Longimycelium tulufanense]|uniref:Uncharacterized protein n=1 Tax=Longimycelium tulufanense TaxID=907463 RepID=A0A8J3CIN7_9PSEU|nr:hypothetical protein [Longimycelium tulufanense]GGM81886.1 hypothetical protein GCM10012275_60610 [Longimycelium tulufanense]